MLEFQEKRKVKRLLYSKVTLFFLIIFIILLLNGIWKVYKKQSTSDNNLAKTSAIFNNLQTREKILSSEIERLKTENGTEEEIREKYGLVKPGEEVIIVVDNGENTDSNLTPSTVGFWEKIKNWFK